MIPAWAVACIAFSGGAIVVGACFFGEVLMLRCVVRELHHKVRKLEKRIEGRIENRGSEETTF